MEQVTQSGQGLYPWKFLGLSQQNNSWCDLVLAAALPPMWDRSRGIQRSLPPSTPMNQSKGILLQSSFNWTAYSYEVLLRSELCLHNGKSIFPTHATRVTKLHQSTGVSDEGNFSYWLLPQLWKTCRTCQHVSINFDLNHCIYFLFG